MKTKHWINVVCIIGAISSFIYVNKFHSIGNEDAAKGYFSATMAFISLLICPKK